MAHFENPQFDYADNSAPILINREFGTVQSSSWKDFDFMGYSKKAKKISSVIMTIQKPFELAKQRIYLYTRTPMPGGTKLVFPFEQYNYKYPKWKMFGRNAGCTILPKIGIELSNATIISAAKWLKRGGKGFGLIGLGLAIGDMFANDINWSNGLYFVMSVLAMNPETAPIAFGYFVIDAVLLIATDKGVGDYIEMSLEGKDTIDQAATLIRYANLIGTVYNVIEIVKINNRLNK